MNRQQIMSEIQKCEHRNRFYDDALGRCEPYSFKEGAVLAVCQGTFAALTYWREQLEAFDRGC